MIDYRNLNNIIVEPYFFDEEVNYIDICGNIGIFGYSEGVTIIDVSNASSPVQLGFISTDSPVKRIKIIDNSLYLMVENGIKISSSKFCIFVDADLSCGISGILKVSKELKNYDLVIGYRVSNKKRTFLRNFLTRSYILLINFLFKMKIKDYQCGLKGFRKEKILPILEKIKNKDFFWDTELIIRSQKSNLKIKEVPVTWIEKRKSKIKVLRTSLKFLLKIIKFKLLY